MFDPTIPIRFDFGHVGPVQKSNFGDFFINYQFDPLRMVEKYLLVDRKW